MTISGLSTGQPTTKMGQTHSTPHFAIGHCHGLSTSHLILQYTIVDMMILAYYYLQLHPREYVLSNSEHTTPFCLQDIHLLCGPCKIDTQQAPVQELWSTTFINLEFTTQKNGIKGKVITLASQDPMSGVLLWPE